MATFWRLGKAAVFTVSLLLPHHPLHPPAPFLSALSPSSIIAYSRPRTPTCRARMLPTESLYKVSEQKLVSGFPFALSLCLSLGSTSK